MSTTVKVKPEEITILPPEVEEKVTNEILVIRSEANVTDELIKSLKEEYGSLTIKDQSDKEGYLNVQAARKAVKKVRVAAAKLFDKGKEEAVAVADKWLESKKSVIDALKEIEDPLEKQEEEYEEEDKRIKAANKAKMEQQGMVRMKHMLEFGAELQGSNWVLGEVSYEAALIKESDDDIYQTMYTDFKAVFDVKEKDRLDREAKDLEDKAELLRQQDAIKQQQKEVKDMRTQARISFLESLGMTKDTNNSLSYGNLCVPFAHIEHADGHEWEVIIAGARDGVEKAKENAKEAQRKKELFQDRLAKLKGWGYNGSVLTYPEGMKGENEDTLIEMPEDNFTELVKDNDLLLADLEEKKEEKRLKDLEDARLEGLGKSRREMLKAINGESGLSDLQLGGIEAEQWERDLKIATALHNIRQKAVASQQEKERLELLGEKQRYEEMIAAFRAVPIGEYKSGQYRAKIKVIQSFIDNLK